MFYLFCADILSLFWRSPLPVPRDVLQHLVHQQESSQRGKSQGAAKQTEVLALSTYLVVKYLSWICGCL